MDFNSDVIVLGTLETNKLGDSLREQIEQQIGDSWDKRVPLLTAEFSQEREETMQRIAELEAKLAELQTKYNDAVRQFNVAIETINAMSARLSALEANYDPTIIK